MDRSNAFSCLILEVTWGLAESPLCFFLGGGGGWVAASIASYPQYWPLFLAALHLWAGSCITIEQQVTFSYVCENILWVQWTRVAFLIHCQLGTSCINRHFCILDVAEIESFICCLFSCVMEGHDATWLLIAINAPFHSWFVYVDFVVVLNKECDQESCTFKSAKKQKKVCDCCDWIRYIW